MVGLAGGLDATEEGGAGVDVVVVDDVVDVAEARARAFGRAIGRRGVTRALVPRPPTNDDVPSPAGTLGTIEYATVLALPIS